MRTPSLRTRRGRPGDCRGRRHGAAEHAVRSGEPRQRKGAGRRYVRLINRNSGKDLDGANQQWQLIALGATPGAFTNPIKRNGPDPWLQHHNGAYYLATTTWNSTITMRRSTTLAGLATAADQVVFNLADPVLGTADGPGERGPGTAVPRRPGDGRLLRVRLLGTGLQAGPAQPYRQRPDEPSTLDEVAEPGVPAQRREQRVRPGPQRILQVAGRHRGLDRPPRDGTTNFGTPARLGVTLTAPSGEA